MNTVSSSTPTVIIAAYNEANIIQNTLRVLTGDNFIANDKSSFQVMVVCNGCSDNTAELVTQNFPQVHCCSIQPASKALAIQKAESFNPGFPRLYLDADIELSKSDALFLFAQASNTSPATLLIPSSVTNSEQSSNAVKRFYTIWEKTPYTQILGYGAGAYLLNKAGRERFNIWPELIADDAFVRSQFSSEEIQIATDCKVSVKAPKDLKSLIKVKARSKHGNLQLRRYLELNKHHKYDHKKPMSLSSVSTNIVDKIVYVLINVTALAIAKAQHLTGSKKWLRDHSNRS